MMPLKQQAPTGGLGQAGMEYGKQEFSGVAQIPQVVCVRCAYYEVITRKRGHVHGLCHFTGRRDPLPGQDGCSFLAGKWDAIDEILGLRKSLENDKLQIPNTDRRSGSLIHAQHGKNSGIFALKRHISCHNRHEYKLRHNVQEPARAGGLSVAGERYAVFV